MSQRTYGGVRGRRGQLLLLPDLFLMTKREEYNNNVVGFLMQRSVQLCSIHIFDSG